MGGGLVVCRQIWGGSLGLRAHFFEAPKAVQYRDESREYSLGSLLIGGHRCTRSKDAEDCLFSDFC